MRFRSAKKQPDESYVYFCSRLHNLLRYYLHSREAETDAEKIIDVCVSDRLKESLSPSTLNYVLSLQGDGTFASEKVASTADIYVNNYTEDGKYRTASMHFFVKGREHVSSNASASTGNSAGRTVGAGVTQPLRGAVKPQIRLCFKCKSDQHLLPNCPLRSVRQVATHLSHAPQRTVWQ